MLFSGVAIILKLAIMLKMPNLPHQRLLTLALLGLFVLIISGCMTVDHTQNPSFAQRGDVAIAASTSSLAKLQTNLSDCRAGDEGSDFACVSLLYGTNRGPKQYKEKFYGYAPLPIGSPQILGEVVISLPKPKGERRKQDKIEKTALSPEHSALHYHEKGFAIWGGEDTGLQELTAAEFEQLTRARVNQITKSRKSALVFIHGYKESFESAALQTAQLKTSLLFEGPAFFFSWPSNDTGAQYLNDQQDADFSAQALADFLRVVKKSVGETTELNIVAHSLGNRVVGQAFEILRQDIANEKPFIETAIFAAADLDENLFEKWIVGPPNAAPLVKKPIVYVTDDDLLLRFSKTLLAANCSDHDPKYRVGLVTKSDCETGERRVSVFSKPFETVDLSNEPGEKFLGVLGKNHFKHSQSRKVMCHMARLFDGGEVSDFEENDIVERAEVNGRVYWTTDVKRKVKWLSDCFHDGKHPDTYPAVKVDLRALRNLSP